MNTIKNWIEILKKWSANLNDQQRIIVAIFLLLTMFIIGYGIAGFAHDFYSVNYGFNINVEATDFNKTWPTWLIITVVTGYLEYKLFNRTNEK